MRYAPKHVLGAIKVDAGGNTYGLLGELADTFCVRSVRWAGSSYGSPIELQQQVGGGYRNALVVDSGGHVAIGLNFANAHGYALAVKGTVHAQEFDADMSNWSDFVFKPGYEVKPLVEVDKYIQKNKHLPGVPSEAEVRKKGVHVGDMQKRLLAKIEELTIYVIQQQKQIDSLKMQVANSSKK